MLHEHKMLAASKPEHACKHVKSTEEVVDPCTSSCVMGIYTFFLFWRPSIISQNVLLTDYVIKINYIFFIVTLP